jgi:DNA-binding transcriptional ArsR family regulator
MTGNVHDIVELAELFRVLGHETRLGLVGNLHDRGESSVGQLEAFSGVGQPALSQQLAVLRKAELVLTRREAKQVYYRINPDKILLMRGFLSALASDQVLMERPASLPTPTAGAAGFARIISN